MTRHSGTLVLAFLLSGSGLTFPLRADDAAKAILDKGITALGGEEKLKKIEAMTWKTKGKLKIGENENEYTAKSTAKGLDHYLSEFNSQFNGDDFKAIAVLKGDKGWRKFGDNTMELDGDALANEKRRVYLQVIPTTLVPLAGKGYKIEAAGEEKVAGKPAAGLKATGPDGKEFTIYFDKTSGLPVKLVAKVVGFDGQEYTEEQTYQNYKDFGGIKKATKLEAKRDGESFLVSEITEFKVLDHIDPKIFSEPE
jgi:hypothetical protein